MNKSEAIRQVIAESPDIKAAAAVELLKTRGVETNTSLFYLVKGKQRPKPSRPSQPSQMDAITAITRVKQFASGFGGVGKLKRLVDAIAE